MKTILGKTQFWAHGSKDGNWGTFEEFLEDREISLSEEEKKKFYDLLYLLYEISANITIFDDGTYEVTSFRYDNKIWVPQ